MLLEWQASRFSLLCSWDLSFPFSNDILHNKLAFDYLLVIFCMNDKSFASLMSMARSTKDILLDDKALSPTTQINIFASAKVINTS